MEIYNIVRGQNLRAYVDEKRTLHVWSYGVPLVSMGTVETIKQRVLFWNDTTYSTTTTRHQGIALAISLEYAKKYPWDMIHGFKSAKSCVYVLG